MCKLVLAAGLIWATASHVAGSDLVNIQDEGFSSWVEPYLDHKRSLEQSPKLGIGETSEETPGVVEKKTFSSKMRLVFLVGVEGTGHHLVNKALEQVCQSADVVCPNVCSIAEGLYKYLGKFNTASRYKEGIERLRRGMNELRSTADGLGNVTSPMLASFFACEGQVGEMSFPNLVGADKALQYVDLKILAAEAERVNVDLRMVYLARSSNEILASTTEHRHFGR